MISLENQSLDDGQPSSSAAAELVSLDGENPDLSRFFFDRLAEVLQGHSVADFARNAKLPYSAMRNYADRRSLPGVANFVKIARAAGKSLDWFAPPDWTQDIGHIADALEDVTTQAGREIARRRQQQPEDFCMVRLYDVRASAGSGAWNDSERVKTSLAFRREWIASDLRVAPDKLMLVYVDGDSMEPTLSDGDVVMVDKSQRELTRPGVYVFLQEGALMIKRLQAMPGQRVLVLSDNERFARYELSATDFEGESARASMIGRVVWSGIRL
jgi:phage repressor protein C with HTH and peptisase S24 domain